MNRHILSQALLSGTISVSALQRAYPDELSSALLVGRLLPDLTKKGGAFGRSTDFDLAVLDRPLGGTSVFREVSGNASDALTEQIRNSITDPNLQGLDIDFKYATFENNSAGGLLFTNRGRSFFYQGRFLGRQQSRLYGQSGRVVRDLPELFTKNPPPRGISTTDLLANSPVAATWASDITFGLIGAQDTIRTARDNQQTFSAVGNGLDAVVGGPSALNSYIGGIASRFQVSAEPASESVSPSVAAATSFVFNVARPDDPNTPLEAVVQEAIASWGTLVADSSVKNITIRMEDLPGNQLGYSQVIATDALGQVEEGLIVFDARDEWFIDTTPSDDVEFSPGGVAADSYDLLSTAIHEVGHLLGFGTGFSEFDKLTSIDADGQKWLNVDDAKLSLTEDGNELNPHLHSDFVMSATLSRGMRRRPTQQEIGWAELLAGGTGNDTHTYFHHGQAHGGFVSLAASVESSLSTLGLPTNFDLQASNTEADDFGWFIVGDASVAAGSATITEGDGMLSSLSQTFALPDAESISFTLALDSLADGNPDAFEVALLDANSTDSLFGELLGLADGDALLNVQPTGEIYFSDGVSTSASVPSGGTIDLSQPLNVTIELPEGLADDLAATLYFDLVGFGEDNCQVSISGLSLLTDDTGTGTGLPDVSVALDSLSDTGVVGDAITNRTSIDVTGTASAANIEVALDIDGDGFDDGLATADQNGDFRFDGIGISEGPNLIQVQVENVAGTATDNLMVTRDTQSPTADVVTPGPGTNVSQDLGYVDVRWSDSGAAGIDLESIDAADLAVSGFDVERVESLGGDVYRYFYGEDGDELVEGEVTVEILSEAVRDLADNASSEASFTFAFSPIIDNVDPTFFGPSPYLSIADTPTGFLSNCADCLVELEDFEDDSIHVDLSVSPGEIILPGFGTGTPRLTDSVDADDGVIDGSGQTGDGGHSFFNLANSILVEFDQRVTAGGLVWTDGDAQLTNVLFEAFDQDSNSIGSIEAGDLSDSVFTGTTDEDRFFGVQFGDGVESWISSLRISNEGGEGIEIDHIQYEYMASSLFGDVNEDGVVDVGDIDRLTQAIRDQSQQPIFDLNADNQVSEADRDRLLEELNVIPGDLDLNGQVDFRDFLVLSHNFGQTDVGWGQGNVDFDSEVTFQDFSLLNDNFGTKPESAAGEPPQTLFHSLDTTADGHITARDALLVINYINVPASSVGTPYHLDVERDGLITSKDALIVINELNRSAAESEKPRQEWESEADDFYAATSEGDDENLPMPDPLPPLLKPDDFEL